MQPNDIEILEDFVRENDDLDRLETLASAFNTFEVLGLVRRELRHSDFLAYLLDPRENHGLGESFVKRLLKKACLRVPTTENSISAIELDTMDFEGLEVRREWRNIDILLKLDTPRSRLIVAIENKIDSTEHSQQLQRYLRQATQEFPGYRVLFLYLTVEGDTPSEANFLPTSYSLVATVLESLLRSPVVSPPIGARSLMEQYCQTIRRHFMTQSDIADLCSQIYKKHKKALDLIVQYMPDDQSRIREFLTGLIEEKKEFILNNPEKVEKSYLRFSHSNWEIPALLSGVGWSGTGRMLLFEFAIRKDSLKLALIIGPGPENVRRKLFEMALSGNCQLLKPFSKTLNQKWNSIYSRTVLSSSDFEEGDLDLMRQKISQSWADFCSGDLPLIIRAVKETNLEP